MKLNKWIFILTSLLVITIAIDTEARGRPGGGGGPRGGGGGPRMSSYRGGNNINRSPSMSRSDAYNRPSSFNRSDFNRTNLSRINSPAAQMARNNNLYRNPATRNQLNNYLQNTRNQNLSQLQNLPTQNSPNLPNRNLSNLTDSGALRNNLLHDNPGYGNWFNSGFFQDRGAALPAYANGNLWRAATWNNALDWMGTGWSQPYYYGYGDDVQSATYPANQTDQTAYYPTQPDINVNVQPQEETADTSNPDNWLPLGVFALASDQAGLSSPTTFLQLALNKNGELDGTFYDSQTNKIYPIDGLVDKTNQQVAMKISSQSNAPLIVTGIYNLTQDQTPVTIVFSEGIKQTWQMARVPGQ